MPAFAGYELIDLVDATDTNYQDNNGGSGLSAGATYCYRLVARFPQPGGGVSIVSTEICDSIPAVRPIITNVDVNRTDEADGEVIVRWVSAFDFDPPADPGPLQYEILRIEEDGATTSVGTTDDLSFTDTGLNTLEEIYRYRIVQSFGDATVVDTSSMASSVRPEPTSAVSAITLNWSAEVPWSNRSQRFPYHYIYRNNVTADPEELVMIDSVDVSRNGLRYVDDGSFNGEELNDDTEYCYYIITQGTYGNPDIVEPLRNRSQVICSQPNDIIPPCTPVGFGFDPEFDCVAFLRDQDCNFNDFTNHLLWTEDEDAGCQDDIVRYNIYYSVSDSQEDFELIASVADTEYFHEGLTSFKGCYKISAVDRSGNESALSASVCRDNCPNYELPNVFTPNNDGQNDTFTPFFSSSDNPIMNFDNSRCPRFVERVVFQVVDRTGNELFFYDSDENENNILIEWEGVTNSGSELASGTYFYHVEVTYDVLRDEDSKERFKGWVQLFR